MRRTLSAAIGVLVLRSVGAFAPARLLTGAGCLPALRVAAFAPAPRPHVSFSCSAGAGAPRARPALRGQSKHTATAAAD